MNVYVIRNGQQYGPYDVLALLDYVNKGHVLQQDRAIEVGGSEEHPVSHFLSKSQLKPKVENKGNIASQLRDIGSELIFPYSDLFSRKFITDQRFQVLALVGFLPLAFLMIPLHGSLLFYIVALYFSMIWGLFFFAIFKTSQVTLRSALIVFFLTQFFVFILWDTFDICRFNPFYHLLDYSLPLRFIGFTLGVGVMEEMAKMIPLIIILHKAKEPQVPQTMVYYGLMSGIAFGVYEGVEYQTSVNIWLDYDYSFFFNIARLTSCPFMHACWCGIAGYFLSFAHLYPKYRRGLSLLALSIPALLHGIYDTQVSVDRVPLPLVIFTLLLLMIYLKQGVNYQSRLKD